jgi:hypothetical protein
MTDEIRMIRYRGSMRRPRSTHPCHPTCFSESGAAPRRSLELKAVETLVYSILMSKNVLFFPTLL